MMIENAQVLASESTPPQPITLQPWDRRPDEPGKWYERFSLYRSLGHARSITGAYRLYLTTYGSNCKRSIDEIGNAPSTWYDNAERWQWEDRATTFDDHERDKLFADETLLRETIRKERIETLTLLLKVAKRGLELKNDETLGKESTAALSQATKTSIRELREELDGYSSKTKLEVDIILKQLPPELQKLIQSAIKPGK